MSTMANHKARSRRSYKVQKGAAMNFYQSSRIMKDPYLHMAMNAKKKGEK